MVQVWQRDFFDLGSLPTSYQLKKLAQDFLLLEFGEVVSAQQLLKTVFPRWVSPVEHQWPTKPASDGFVERASQGLARKFANRTAHIEVFATSVKFKAIAKGLRGRLNQLFSELQRNSVSTRPRNTPESGSEGILSVIVDEKGLFAGVSPSRLHIGTALVGGLGFLSKCGSEDKNTATPSRAGGKIKEVLDLFGEIDSNIHNLENWLELGAAPGGMTQQLVDWGARVTAVDLADLDPRIAKHPNVTYRKINAQDITSAAEFDALLSDMNGPYENASQIVGRLSQSLPSGAIVVYVLKLNNSPSPRQALDSVLKQLSRQGLKIQAIKHLFHNRQELTLMCQRI